MWRYVVSGDGKVTDIYFLTQLTPDEKVSMVSGFPMPLLVDLDLHMPVPLSSFCHYLLRNKVHA